MCNECMYYKDSLLCGMTSSDITALAALLGVIAAIIGGVIAYLTYRSNENQRRFEFFSGIYNKYLDDERTNGLRDLFIKEANITDKKESEWTDEDRNTLRALEDYPEVHKYYWLATIEQVAIALNSDRITKSVAHHMFGYFSIRSFESKYFWKNMPGEKEDDQYWKVYKDFVAKMKKMETENLKANQIRH
jgi:hypothetical protein